MTQFTIRQKSHGPKVDVRVKL